MDRLNGMSRRTPTRSQAVLLAGYAVRLALALGVTVILGRTLSAAAFGFFTLIATTFFVVTIVFTSGTSQIAVRELARRPERERPLLEGMLGWRLLCAIPLSGVVLIWAANEPDSERRLVLIAVAIVIPLMVPSALMPLFWVRQEQGGPVLIRIFSQTLVLAGSLVFRALQVTGPLFAVLPALRALTNSIGVGWLAIKRLGYLPRPRLRGVGLRPLLGQAAVQAAVGLVQMAYFHVDVFMVLVLAGDAELGAYSAAFRPINPLLALPSLFVMPLFPMLTRAAQDRARLSRIVRSAATLLLGIAALAAAAGVVLANDLIDLLYGGRYGDGSLDASPALAWLSLAFGIFLSTSIFSTALLADGRERLLLRFALLGLAINVVGNVILIPIWGFTAAAFVTAVTYAVVGAAALLTMIRLLAGRVLSLSQLLAFLPGVVLGATLWQLDGTSLERVLAGSALGLAGVVLLLALPAARRFRRQVAEEVDSELARSVSPEETLPE